MAEINSNYTGYAVLGRDKETLIGVGEYRNVGMYTPCVYVENGVAKKLRLGGLPEAEGTIIDKLRKVLVSV